MLKTTTPSGVKNSELWMMCLRWEQRDLRKRLSSQAESSVADKSSPLRHITAPEEATQKEEEENAVKLTGSLHSSSQKWWQENFAKTLTLIPYKKCSKAHHEVISCQGASSLQVWVTWSWDGSIFVRNQQRLLVSLMRATITIVKH